MHASEGPVTITNQLKSIYNCPFKDSHSHPIHTCFSIIASNFRGAVPRFYEEGAPTLGGGEGGTTYKFAKFSEKMHEI